MPLTFYPCLPKEGDGPFKAKHTRFFQAAQAPKEPKDVDKSRSDFSPEIRRPGSGYTWFLREERAEAQEGRLWVPPHEAELSFLMEPQPCRPTV